MKKESLYIMRMVEGKETLFPNAGEPVRLNTATYSAQRMGGTPTLTADFYYPRILDEDWTRNEYVWFRGERYYVDQQPSIEKDNTNLLYKHSVTFVSERIILEHEFFYDVVTDTTEAQYRDRYRSNISKFSFYGTIEEFVGRLNDCLVYTKIYDTTTGAGYHVVIDDDITSSEIKEISFENKRLAEALQEINKTYELAYYFVGKTIHVGYTENAISEPFKYGMDGGLLKIQRTNSNEAIVDRITGVGSSENLPYYYPNLSADGEALYKVKNSGVEGDEVIESIRLSALYKTVKYPIGATLTLCHQDRSKRAFFLSDMTGSTSLYVSKTESYGGQGIGLNWLGEGTIEKAGPYFYAQKGTVLTVNTVSTTIDTIEFGPYNITPNYSNEAFEKINRVQVTNSTFVKCQMTNPRLRIFDVSAGNTSDISIGTPYTLSEDSQVSIRFVCDIRIWFNEFDTGHKWIPDLYAEGYSGNVHTAGGVQVSAEHTYKGGDSSIGDSEYYFIYKDSEGETKELRYEDSGIVLKNIGSLNAIGHNITYDTEKGFVVEDDSKSTIGTEITITGRKWINPTQKLMPSIYRESLGAERYFNAVKEGDYNRTFEVEEGKVVTKSYEPAYQIGQTDEHYTFKNLYKERNPHTDYQEDDTIKPTIKGVRNDVLTEVDEEGKKCGQLFGEIADIAFDDDDDDSLKASSEKDSADYTHSYFYIKLHKFSGDMGFNLFDYASESDTAKVNMTSGNCAGCSFEIGVPEPTEIENGKYKFTNGVQVKANGDIVDGTFSDKVKNDNPIPSQQDTSKGEVWIALKKEISTYGVVMPNHNQNYKPNIGDTFTISGINAPQVYITAAEKRLDKALVKYMSEHNEEKFNFSITFSRIWLTEHPDIAAKINENARLSVEYNGVVSELYVTDYSVKLDTNILEEITVTLAENIDNKANATLTAKLNSMKEDILSSVTGIDFVSLRKLFLSKQSADRTKYKLASDTAFEVGNFVAGSQGAMLFQDAETGQTTLEVDRIYARIKAYFEQLEIVNVNSIGGKQIISPAGAIRVSKVEFSENACRCYFVTEQDGEKIENRFAVGDMGYSQSFNVYDKVSKQVSNRYYWRKIVAVGEDYIELSMIDCDTGSDLPEVGDVICQRGSINADRNNFLEFSAVDSFSPSITLYSGVSGYTLLNKDVVSYGVDKTSGKAFMNVYGDMYIGDRGGESFLKFDQTSKTLKIKGTIDITSPLAKEDGTTTTLGEALAEANDVSAQLSAFDETIRASLEDIDINIQSIQNQVDGAIETWFYKGKPTLINEPASLWDKNKETGEPTGENTEKDTHLGDLYYDSDTGRAYRFQKSIDKYEWVEIKDTDIAKALGDAKDARDLADKKRRVFYTDATPVPPYDLGDLWVQGEDGDIMRCDVARKEKEEVGKSDWVKASKYTDDTVAAAANEAAGNAATAATEAAQAASDLGDYVNGAFSDGIISSTEASSINKYKNAITTAQKEADAAYEKVHGSTLCTGVTKTALENAKNAFDAAVSELTSTIDTIVKKETLEDTDVPLFDTKYSNFNDKYYTFMAALNAANVAIQEATDTKVSNAQKAIGNLDYLKDALGQDTVVEGGLVLSSLMAMGYTDEKKQRVTMSGISGIYSSSQLGGGIGSWWGGKMLDRQNYTINAKPDGVLKDGAPGNIASSVIRMDGTGYFANGSLWWDKDGVIHTNPQSFIINKDQISDYVELFQIRYKSGYTNGAENISYVSPKFPMDKVAVADSVTIGELLLSYDSKNNALALTRKNGGAAGFYASGFVSAMGANASMSGGGGGHDMLPAWSDYTAAKKDWVVGAKLLYELYSSVNNMGSTLANGATSITTTGGGNAVTSVTKSGNTITFDKGATFLTSHQSLANYSTLANTIKSLSVSGKTITYTKGDNTTGSITTQDTTYSFSNKAATLAWDTAVTVATVGGVDITVKLPANPNTDHYAWGDITGKPTNLSAFTNDLGETVTQTDINALFS